MTAESQLKSKINEDMKNAMRNKDKARLGTIRMLLAAIKQREIDDQIKLDDAGVLAVIDKMCKQRKDSLQQYQTAGREDLAAVEEAELVILATYLPEPLSESEMHALVDQAIEALKIESVRDMGKLMAHLKGELQGRADMGTVSEYIKSKL